MKTASLDALTTKVASWNPSRLGQDEFSYIDLGSVSSETKSIGKAARIRGAEAPSRARQLLQTGDVLVSTVRPNLNAVAQVPARLDGATGSTGFTVLRPTERLDAQYLFHWVQSRPFVMEMVRRATGASYPAVSDKIVKESMIPLPPLAEQRRIAAILDRADALRVKRRQVLADLSSLKQSLYENCFGLTDGVNSRLAASPLADWIDPSRPITYGILKPGPDIPDGIPYVRVADMQGGQVRLDTVRRTTAAIHFQYRRSTLRSGDLLMSIRGHVGRLVTIPSGLDGANITQDSARLAVVNPDRAVYVRATLESQTLQAWMGARTKGAAVQGINLGDLRNAPIPVADDRKITKFAVALRQIEAQQSLGALHSTLIDEAFTSLQARAFRGEL